MDESLTSQQEQISRADQKRGQKFINWANNLTQFRSDSALPLGVAIGCTDENWPVTIAVAAAMATDAGDGYFARKGAKLLGIETSPEGAIADPQADKDLVNGLLVGLASRYIRQKRYGSAALVGLNYLAIKRRDERMKISRQLVVDHDLNKNELKAKKINKVKMDIHSTGIEVLVSPISKDIRYRMGALAVLSLGTYIGWLGERKYSRRVSSLIALKRGNPARFPAEVIT